MAVHKTKQVGQQLRPHVQKYCMYHGYCPMNWSTLLIAYMWCLSCFLQFTATHVALTYPPARKYDLDFLDNLRTKQPCGMPRGSTRTPLLSGSKFNVTWHLAYPHKGGFRLQLLDSLDRPLVDLTPHLNGSEFVRTDATAHSHQVTLPNDFDCYNCTLRLLQQADEWSSGYRFWSCADVDIKQRKEFTETCSGNGKYFPSRCKCEKNFYGPQCQYKDECSSNKDCGIQGKCVDLQGTSLPRKQCYCNFGWYGRSCSKRSPYKTTEFDLSAYAMKQLSQDYKIYWRLLEEQKEIEVMLKVNCTTWVGFGWRPRTITKDCKNFPLIESVIDLSNDIQKPQSTESGPFSEPEPESSLELELKSDSVLASEPETKSEEEGELEPNSESDSASKSRRVVQIENQLAIDGVTSVATSVSYRISASSDQIRRDVSDSKKYNFNPYTPDFSPMDCTDIIIGSARGMASRVGDYYTRDRSTPRRDEFYGGKNDLTLATGFEKDGITTIIFRKKLFAFEPTDHSLDDELTHVIWARGQESGNYVNFPASGIDSEISSIKQFYQPDELKYHGYNRQRGVIQMNFYEKLNGSGVNDEENSSVLDNDCYGRWQYPSNCSPENHTCQYYVSWETIGGGYDMHWHIETTNTQTWTGIGFSNDEKMSQTDSIIGWVDRNGRSFLMDTWINGYSSPKLDDRQDVFDAFGYIEKGVTILEFTRKRISNDEQDLSFTDDHCLYLFFPVLGGAFNAVNKKIRKHESVPAISPTRVCIKSCGKELEQIKHAPTTPAPNRLVYSVVVKLMNLAEYFNVAERGTAEFNNLAATISDSFNGILNDIPGYYKTEILSFEKKGTTSMIANLQAIFDKDEYEKGHDLFTNTIPVDFKENTMKNGDLIKIVLRDKISSGKVGSLTVDPQFLDFQALEYKPVEHSEDTKLSFLELSEVRLYTIIGLIAALVFIALIQASCTIYTSKRNNANKDNLIQSPSWKDYASNTNYAFDPYGEAEEKALTSATETPQKEKTRNQRQMATLQMPHPPTNKSQMHYENTLNGGSSSGNNQKYSSKCHSQQRSGKPSITEDYENDNYDRHNGNELREPGETQRHYPQSSTDYSQSPYVYRAYSLPRQLHQQQANMQPSGYYTQDRRDKSAQSHSDSDERRHHRDRSREDPRLVSNSGADTPDFYFMPSQRKYSGEVVRVFVDYNKDPKQ